MTAIWSATAKGQPPGTYRVPVDVSSSGSASYIQVSDLIDILNPATKLKKWRLALAKQRTGTYRPRVVCLGDSTTFGLYSNGSTTGDHKLAAYPTLLAQMFTSAGYECQDDSSFGGNTASSPLLVDGRISNGGTAWSLAADDATGRSFGGRYIQASSAGTLVFTPRKQCDSFKIWYISEAGRGVLSYSINGSGGSTIDTSLAAGTVASVTITGTLGSNALHFEWSSGGSVKVVAYEGWDSNKDQISVMNAGWGNSTATNWKDATNFYSPKSLVSTFAADLYIVNLGINDCNGGIATATYSADMQTLITELLLYGDVILVSFTPISIANKSLATQQTYIDVVYDLAKTNSLGLIDVWRRFVSYEIMDPLGYYYDVLHPRDRGLSDMAQAVFNVIGSP